jgi:hypothetical protein
LFSNEAPQSSLNASLVGAKESEEQRAGEGGGGGRGGAPKWAENGARAHVLRLGVAQATGLIGLYKL